MPPQGRRIDTIDLKHSYYQCLYEEQLMHLIVQYLHRQPQGVVEYSMQPSQHHPLPKPLIQR